MIVAESIGFAATHTISSILAELPGFRVTHGSQNFETAGAIGTPAQTPEDFAASMVAAGDRGERPVALHTLFDPRRMQPVCAGQGIRYALLLRDPQAQVESCYAWAAKKTLDGDESTFVSAMKSALPVLPGLGIRATLPNLLYAYALNHVCQFNVVGLDTGAPVLKMEELLSDEALFRDAFDVGAEAEIPHFSGEARHLASHRAREGLEALAAPERATIRALFPVRAGATVTTLAELGTRLGYAA
ncbi:hypothetical protein GCM10011534_24130 [Pseudooceanicola nanhaiensis]|uniref:Sulfotransferase family protein n=2 Tax=Pseudooceanicola nanhaiensis TaxID=375761 RepID=A0A917WF31_9RHOB|nr:hypothetical protein [Pseudooceanicola nanhaiensis]GGM01444.1 hypothetical protein GCM10011534_24130 [Pseudooceanicola nanhaiensis]